MRDRITKEMISDETDKRCMDAARNVQDETCSNGFDSKMELSAILNAAMQDPNIRAAFVAEAIERGEAIQSKTDLDPLRVMATANAYLQELSMATEGYSAYEAARLAKECREYSLNADPYKFKKVLNPARSDKSGT